MLKAFYKTQEEIPAGLEEYYKEVNGQWELQVEGMKTSKDVATVQEALRKERKNSADAKAALKAWTDAFDDLTPDAVQEQLDKIPALEAGQGGTVDEAKIEALVTARVKPLLTKAERAQIAAEKRSAELEAENGTLKGTEKSRKIKEALRTAASSKKVLETAIDDVLNYAGAFDVDEEGKVTTKDGLDAEQWLTDISDKRPHWWPPSQGGGATGSKVDGKSIVTNPWSAAGWNFTLQSQYVTKHGMEKANQMAQLAGTKVGGTRPKK